MHYSKWKRRKKYMENLSNLKLLCLHSGNHVISTEKNLKPWEKRFVMRQTKNQTDSDTGTQSFRKFYVKYTPWLTRKTIWVLRKSYRGGKNEKKKIKECKSKRTQKSVRYKNWQVTASSIVNDTRYCQKPHYKAQESQTNGKPH